MYSTLKYFYNTDYYHHTAEHLVKDGQNQDQQYLVTEKISFQFRINEVDQKKSRGGPTINISIHDLNVNKIYYILHKENVNLNFIDFQMSVSFYITSFNIKD